MHAAFVEGFEKKAMSITPIHTFAAKIEAARAARAALRAPAVEKKIWKETLNKKPAAPVKTQSSVSVPLAETWYGAGARNKLMQSAQQQA